MVLFSRAVRVLPFLTIFLGIAGCSGVDSVSRKMDQASEHLSSSKPVYEGHLVSSQTVGALISLQFTDGQIYEVNAAPSLKAGDIVRIYKTDKGLEAHLWEESTEPLLPGVALPASSPSLPGK